MTQSTIRRQFEFPAAQYFKTVSQNQKKNQFFFIRLKKMLNLLSEWGKMAKRRSNLNEKVPCSSENILLDLKIDILIDL